MCRRNFLRGWLLISFGAGIIVSTLFGDGFLLFAIGVAAIVGGFCLLKK